MPVLSTAADSEAVAAAVADLEREGHTVNGATVVGDTAFVFYVKRAKPGRPPKETR